MALYRYLLMMLSIALLFMNTVNASSKSQNEYRSFWNPTYLGQRLAYCTVDNKMCGLGIANQYCKLMGYDNAALQLINYNVGLTHYLATRAQCKGWTCNGFMLIRCASKLIHSPPKAYAYRLKKFVLPRFDHYRIDWCYENGHGCGQRAAYSFCRRMGYMHAKNYKKQTQVTATRSIGNQRLCFGDACNAFSSITCSR